MTSSPNTADIVAQHPLPTDPAWFSEVPAGQYYTLGRMAELLRESGCIVSVKTADTLKPWETLSYANIAHACFLIAIDNGGINRGRNAQRWRHDYEDFIERVAAPLTEIDAWLGSLTEAQMDVVASGGDDDAQTFLLAAPAFTDDLLNSYFDEVC